MGAEAISITNFFTVRKGCNVARLSETGILSGQDRCMNNVKPQNAEKLTGSGGEDELKFAFPLFGPTGGG